MAPPPDAGLRVAPSSDPEAAAQALIDATLATPLATLDPRIWRPGVLRITRRLPMLQEGLAEVLTDPLQRAEAGVGELPATTELAAHIRMGLVRVEQSLSPPSAADARRWEEEAVGHDEWWVPAARLHVLVSPERERAARSSLSESELPYVFPGELADRSVDVLAGGDRVLTALHVDWLRKVTRWVGDAAVADARMLGFWFWPHLRYLAGGQLKKPFQRLLRTRRLPPGAHGMAVAYQHRIGLPVTDLLRALSPEDRFVAAVAIASDRPDAG
jgi:hypothetical protein